MSTVTLDKTEYQALKEKAKKYDQIATTVEEDLFSAPPIRSRKKILIELKNTGRYSKQFLAGIGRGLKRSSYFIP